LAIDGTAFYVAITSMMPARTFHLTQDAYFFAAFFFAQFLLALTGIGFIAMPSMVVAFGIPEVAIATVIGIEPILDMCGTAQSVLGNITSSLLVGRRLGRVDEKTYGSADT
jgi:Na+/H+-dicarboxylate symporter